MRYILVLLMLVTSNLYAANVVEFDEQTNKVKEYKKSVDTTEYIGRTDVIINPTVPENVPIKYLKHDSGQVIELSAEEKTQVDNAQLTVEQQNEIEQIDNMSIGTTDMIKALLALVGVTEQQLKDKIKEQKGLN